MTAPRSRPATLALLSEEGTPTTVLREALQACGGSVVYEASLRAVDRDALKASGARVVVINLGDDEDALDDLHDLLDSREHDIIVNDSAVSAQLQGTDQARWARHLAAKILGQPEIVLPPRPAGAEAPPTFAEHWAARVPTAETIGEAPVAAVPVASPPPPRDEVRDAAPTYAAPVAATPPAPTGALEADPAPVSPATAAAPESNLDIGFGDDDLERALASVDAMVAAVAPEEAELGADDPELARALENFDAMAESAAAPEAHEGVADLESLLSAAHGADALGRPLDDAAPPPVVKASKPTEPEALPDLDFDSIDAALSAVEETPQATPPAPPAPPPKPAVAAPNWSLAADDESPLMSVAEAAREFGIEKVSAAAYLTPQVDTPATEEIDPKLIAAQIPKGFAGLELEPIEEDTPQAAKNTVVYDTGRDLEMPTQATRKRADDDKSKDADATKDKKS